MRRFHLVRSEDVSGVSGTGAVAEGVEFGDGKVALTWNGKLHCVGVYDNVKTVIGVHGHEGRTLIEWIDQDDLVPPKDF